MNIANTIIANSTTGGDYAGSGTINTNLNNLVEDGSLTNASSTPTGSGNISGDPLLGPLQINGGPTLTMALLNGSIAIAAGNATISNATPISGLDQRGAARPSTTPSIGAYDFLPASQITLTQASQFNNKSGSAFTASPIITFKDANGATVTNSTASVTMTVSGGDGKATTVGTTTVNAVAGAAIFFGVGLSGTNGQTYTLTFTSGSFTATQSAQVVYGIATQLIIKTPAATSKSGIAFTTQPAIFIKDAFGNTVSNSSVSVNMAVSGGDSKATIVGTPTKSASGGTATFSGVGISGTAGTSYTLTFTSNGLTATTQSIIPTFGNASKATLSTNADGSTSGSPFTTQPIVKIVDAFGNTITTSNATVSMSVSIGASTTGTTSVSAVAGVATFTNVGISGTTGFTYGLTFASSGLTSATQNITPLTAANTPTFGIPTATAGGFTVQISNYNGSFTYGGTATASGTVAISNTGLVTVSGVAANTSSTATITTARPGYADGSAQISATGLNAANTPTFGAPTATADGFTVLISNYDPNFTYGATATAGSVSINSLGLVTVTGGSPNTSSTATITTTRTNYVSGSAPVTATSLAPTAPLVVGTPPPTSSGGSSTVTLYDPVTGAETGTAVPFPGFSGSIKVVSGDFNNDGVAELIAGAGFGGGPAIAILNSQTGEVMESFFAFDPAFTGGVFVSIQDVNGDGILDIIAGAGPGGGPEVRIFNGDGLTVLRSFYAYAEDFAGGVSVASIDFNNDGILDLVTGAGPGGAPHVKVFDGATNAIISQWFAYPISFTGGVFVAAGDIGNDGNIEVITGAGQGGTPIVAVWDPYTGALLAQFMAYAEDFTGGVRVGINDGNTDGIADIVTGAGPGGGPQVNVFNFPALDLLFSFYSGDPANTGGIFVS